MTAVIDNRTEHVVRDLRDFIPEQVAFERRIVPISMNGSDLTLALPASFAGDIWAVAAAALRNTASIVDPNVHPLQIHVTLPHGEDTRSALLTVHVQSISDFDHLRRLVDIYIGMPERSMPKALAHLTMGQAQELLAIPLAKTVTQELVIGMAIPHDSSEIFEKTGAMKTPFVKMFQRLADAAHVQSNGIIPVAMERDEIKARILRDYTSEQISVSSGESPTQKLLQEIFVAARRLKASDIHIDEAKDGGSVEFRVRGRLRRYEKTISSEQARAMSLSLIDASGVVTGAVDMQALDGRVSRIIEGTNVDARLARLPTVSGQRLTNHSIVLRLTGEHDIHGTLEESGMRGDVLTRYRRLSRYPEGLLINSSRNRQGKSTTIRWTLKELHELMLAGKLPLKRFRSAEDPVEVQMDWIRQTQRRDGFVSFDRALEQFVRMDTDIIFLGEMRDTATINAAITAALLGGVVFTTTHSRSAPGTIRRLLNKGVNRDDLADGLIGVLSQRLVPVLCNCAKDSGWTEDLEVFRTALLADKTYGAERVKNAVLKVPNPKGCDLCGGEGYKAETGIFELLEITDEVAEHIARGSSSWDIAAADKAFRPMLHNAIDLILEGKTTVEEVSNVVRWPW